MYKRLSSIVLVLGLILALLLLPNSASTMAAPLAASITGLHVSGNQILNGSNQPVRLLGVNRSGTEYMCIQGRGIFDGPSDAASVQTIASWHTNAVRVPLNEDCWLAINGVDPSMSGATYQQAIVDYVNLLNSNGLIAIVEMHWNAPGTTQATGQNPMPDSDHAPAFWTSVANTFKSNSSVVFDLFNEPFPDNNSDTNAAWTCWRDGGTCSGVAYPVAGFQSLVNTVRATGATNVIMLGGVQYSNALSQWLTFKPTDSTGNLAASWHVYNFNVCSNTSCWDQRGGPVAQQVPLIAGEIGENDCAHGFIDSLMAWLDSHNASYLGWTWDNWSGACGTGPTLITDYNGTPTNFGIGLRDHLAAISGPTNTPTLTATGPTATLTRTATPGSGTLKVQLMAAGTDNNQQSAFNLRVQNTGTTALANISFRAYFTVDGSNPASGYVFEKYWDQSNAATVSGPTLASGSIYYFTVGFGTASLPAGGSWEFHTALHLNTWASTYDGTNDWWHGSGALPASFTDWPGIPGYIGTTLVWGSEPGGSIVTNTPTRTATRTATATSTLTRTITATGVTNTPTLTRTITPTAPTSTPTITRTPTPTVITNTPTRTNTVTITPTAGSDLCSSATVITGGGSFAVSTTGTCFKFVNTSFRWGALWSVMNGSTSASNTVRWYGVRAENGSACINDSQTLAGNGSQINNFGVGKDANGAMFVTVTGSAANTVSISIQNWQNGSGCSVPPTPHP